MAYDPTIPALNNYIGDDIPKIMANFAELAGSRIVEMGSNSNGEYVRFENGWQVCFRQVSISGSGGGVVNSGTVTLPAAFADTSYQSLVTPRTSDPRTTSSLLIIDASSMTVYWQTSINASGRIISIVAIG